MKNYTEIKRLLNGIGIQIFIDYFQDFNNSELNSNDIIEILPSCYTEKSRRSRVSKARKIINNNQLSEALEYILNSKRIKPELKEQASKFFNPSLRPKYKPKNNLEVGL